MIIIATILTFDTLSWMFVLALLVAMFRLP